MSDTDHSPPPADVGYETTDVNPKTLLAWVAGLACMILLSIIAAWVLFDVLAGYARRADPVISPLAPLEKAVPPEPKLIVDEPHDLASVRRQEQEVLDGYGWVDKAGGVIRIPVERAMDLVAKEGLPSRSRTGKAP
jgi:hypothetical protein